LLGDARLPAGLWGGFAIGDLDLNLSQSAHIEIYVFKQDNGLLRADWRRPEHEEGPISHV
jgi:hypothetical protein